MVWFEYILKYLNIARLFPAALHVQYQIELGYFILNNHYNNLSLLQYYFQKIHISCYFWSFLRLFYFIFFN